MPQITKIYHISDIHFRLYKRHSEYETVLKRLFDYIDETNDGKSVIVLAGDIVHSKIDMSPELVSIVTRFFKSCADRMPTILITGNHDLTLSNKSRLDTLTPIVDAMQHPNLHYWKDSGVYELGGISWSVFSIVGKTTDWVFSNSIDGDYKVALYHGPVVGAFTDMGVDVGGHGVPVEYFDGFDLSLLGDIHKMQYLNREKTIAYSSSLVGQNFAEHPTNHGILVWDVAKRSSKFVKIESDYAYVTIDLVDGQWDMPTNLPHKLRVRIRHENSTPVQIDALVFDLGREYEIVEMIKQKVIKNNILTLDREKVLGDSRSVDYQNSVISEYLSSTGATDQDIESVLALNAETNKMLGVQSNTRNVVWKMKRLEFDNMFSYGEGNIVDFNQLSGVYSINGKNATGKSSLLHILCFTLFDKTAVSTKSAHVINVNKNTFRCKMQIELDGVDYFIERVGVRKQSGAVRVDVNFWYYDNNGIEVSLNGEDRDQTNYAIREKFGMYDDFVMTALSSQYDNQSFVEKSQKERKELLYRFLDVTVFDDLFRLAKETYRRMDVLTKEYAKENLRDKCEQLSTSVDHFEADVHAIDLELSDLKSIKQKYTLELVDLNKRYNDVDDVIDIDSVEASIKSCNVEYDELFKSGLTHAESKKNLLSEIEELKTEIESIPVDVDGLDDVKRDLEIETSRIRATESEIAKLKHERQHCELKVERLSTHQYDPNCKYCTSNEFVVDAKTSADRIIEIDKQISLHELSVQFRKSTVSGLQDMLEVASAKLGLIEKKQNSERRVEDLTNKIDSVKQRIYLCNERKKAFELQREKYFANQKQNEINGEIVRSIEKINKQLSDLTNKEEKLTNSHRTQYAKLQTAKHQYEETVLKYNTYMDYLKQMHIYDIYMKAVSRDGVPYKILQAVLPVIEYEVNLILQQIADFSVKLDTTDEKYVHAYIVYGDARVWPVELTSGMERFVISLAFRQALSEITSLPKPNFMAIDEGFGVLDSDNMSSISRLFDYLKSQYDYLLVISHIETMRDMMDNQIRIEKVDGHSKILVN